MKACFSPTEKLGNGVVLRKKSFPIFVPDQDQGWLTAAPSVPTAFRVLENHFKSLIETLFGHEFLCELLSKERR